MRFHSGRKVGRPFLGQDLLVAEATRVHRTMPETSDADQARRDEAWSQAQRRPADLSDVYPRTSLAQLIVYSYLLQKQ